MYTKKMNLYGAIWAKCPSVAYLGGRLKSRSYGSFFCSSISHNLVHFFLLDGVPVPSHKRHFIITFYGWGQARPSIFLHE